MKLPIAKRLEAVETALARTWPGDSVLISFDDPCRDGIEKKLARWRNGENFPRVPDHIVDRQNAQVILIQGVSPEHLRECQRCRDDHDRSK